VAAAHAADLARAPQQRDDRGRAAAMARLAAEAGVHLGGAAASYLDHALADPADGRDHRHQRDLGVVPQATGDRHSPRRRYRTSTRRRRIALAAFAEAGLPGRYAIGCFGRVRAQKGSDVFVDAMCRLLPRYPDFTAVMVGAITPEQSGFANDLKKRIEAAGLQSRIVITGELPIEEVQRWYRRLTIYAFTSRNEGFGLTLIEAMSAGAALVASRAGAAELVVEDGVTGVLTPPGDVDALVAALEPLMRDPAAATEMGASGSPRVGELQHRRGSKADRGCLPGAGLSHRVRDERVEIAARK
jgi:glycosyltransferase involved in cell wall biosynthesis